MNREQLEQCQRALLKEREAQQQAIEALEESGLEYSLTDSIGDLSSYDNHPSDHGTEMYEREKDIGLRMRAEYALERIEHALSRIEAGTYTKCEECGRPIGTERLLALPYATRCIACQEEEEEREPFHRPVEEAALWPPFGRTFRDGTGETGYDGEDAWQEVARYGTANSPQDVPDAKDYSDAYIDADEIVGAVTEIDALTGGIEPEDPHDDLTLPDLIKDKRRIHADELTGDDELPREGETF